MRYHAAPVCRLNGVSVAFQWRSNSGTPHRTGKNFAENIGSRIDFEDIGNHNMKGIAGTWQPFLVPD
jgi:hypothetical protein